MLQRKDQLLVILGPTATGKTDLALYFAKKFRGELLSCDSRQVYVGLDTGTGKLPSGKWKMEDGRWIKGKGFWILDGVRIWMYDVTDPRGQYTVADYVKDASRVIDKIIVRGKLPIIVGGSGLYLKALLEGLSHLSFPVDKKLREKLQKFSKEELQKKLQQISPKKWDSLNASDRQNSRRLVRAIELYTNPQRTGKIARLAESAKRATLIPRNDVLKIGLTAPRELLYQRADERVVARIKQDMVAEAKKLHKEGLSIERMRQLGLEYGILADYLEGKIKIKADLIKIMQGRIHAFVRRQLTWFKKEKNIKWFDITDADFPENVENLTAKWYYHSDAKKN